MSNISRILKGLGLILAAAMLTGCSAGDVQLEGKIFDALGVGGNQSSRETPKLAQRTPLVVPPSLERLPPPGERPVNPQEDLLASINDPDLSKQVDEEELARQQAAYCEKHYDTAKALNDPEAAHIKGPAGYCRKSVLSGIGGLLGN